MKPGPKQIGAARLKDIPKVVLHDAYTALVDQERVKTRILERKLLLTEKLLQARSLGLIVGGRVRFAGLTEKFWPIIRTWLREIVKIDEELDRVNEEIFTLEAVAARARLGVKASAVAAEKRQALLQHRVEKERARQARQAVLARHRASP